MVARIRTGQNITGALLYNEQKLEQQKASLLGGNNFIIDPSLLSSSEKLNFFRKYISLNQQTKINTLHVSLNFDPSEKLTDEKLVRIAGEYMQQIGFGDQPYLIYRHNDAAHPHIHILSTNIAKDGSRISLHNLGKNKSEPARIAIEKLFGLVKASGQQDTLLTIDPVTAQKIRYGQQSTMQAISNVLSFVISHYKFCSLPELNAVLRLYNVTAETGSKDSLIFKNGGLIYFVTDDKGKRVSAPVKASRFNMKPTLKTLEILFTRNQQLRLIYKRQLIIAIDFALKRNNGKGLPHFVASLKKERITLVTRVNEGGVLYGLTYIDHRSRCVFNGSDLGKAYSANSVRETLQSNNAFPAQLKAGEKKESFERELTPTSGYSLHTASQKFEILPILLDAELSKEQIPYPLKRKRKPKKRRQTKL